jgi:Uma2 family endonuclease
MLREAAQPYQLMTADEFFDWSDGTDTTYELVRGILHAQAYTTKNHSRLLLRLTRRLAEAADNSTCEVFATGAGLRFSYDTVYVPDLTVVCDPSDNDPRFVVRPCVLIEILSPSTQAVDRREKLAAYSDIPSLLAYLIFAQDQQVVERRWRDSPTEPWQMMTYTGGMLPVPCLDFELPLAEIYEGIVG